MSGGVSSHCHGVNSISKSAARRLTSPNFRARTVGRSEKFFSWTDVPRMRLQLKILFRIKALPIPKKNWRNLLGVDATPLGYRSVKPMTDQALGNTLLNLLVSA